MVTIVGGWTQTSGAIDKSRATRLDPSCKGEIVTQAAAQPVGTLATALAHARRLLVRDPKLAEQQVREILKVVPGSAEARGLLVDALRAQGDQFTLAGDVDQADAAYAKAIQASVNDPRLLEAAAALCDNQLAVAEPLLRAHLKLHPTDVAAIRMLAELASRLGRYGDAEKLLGRALELAPGFEPARHNLAIVLYRANKPSEALEQIAHLLVNDPGNPSYRNLKAAALVRIGEFEEAVAIYDEVLKEFPGQPKGWMSYGHALKTLGKQEDSVAAYRKSLALQPGLGEAWWSLANLKTVTFSDTDIAAMRAQLTRTDLSEEDRFHLHFALGKALEDAGDYAESFRNYADGNALRRSGLDYDAAETSRHVARSKALFTPAFFEGRAGQGCAAEDPIFILGLPRAGSTLVEQILASHSQVEGTQELPDIITLAKRLGGRKLRGEEDRYPEILEALSAEELAALGAEFLESTRIQRKTSRPMFIDKMPNNWLHAGLIHLILPNAKIIDARRHPLGCCFSGFKQHFARGQGFTYGLEDIGRYYRDYVELMAHFDAVLPGRIHRVIYEQMIADTETEVRRLLDYCGLGFEENCLRFYETDRAVRTASSEQVRQPIFRSAVDHWQNYEPWLDSLKRALGPVLDAYPEAPAFD